MKKYTYILVIIILVGLGIYFTIYKNKIESPVVETPIGVDIRPINLCFFQEKKVTSALSDRQILRLSLLGSKVTGEYRYLPAEKDSKVGVFEGTVGKVDTMKMSRTADVWWNSMAEGMQSKEQLIVVFGEGTAEVGFGEMVDRGDGVSIYKDTKKLTYSPSMTDVACDDTRLSAK